MIASVLKRRAEAKAQATVNARLAASLRPDPDARAKRLAQWDSARRERYFDACLGTPQSLAGIASPNRGSSKPESEMLPLSGKHSCSGPSAEKEAGCETYGRTAAQEGVPSSGAFKPRQLNLVPMF